MALIDSEGFGFSTALNDYTTYGVFTMLAQFGNAPAFASGGPLGDNYMNTPNSSNPMRRQLPSIATTFFLGNRLNYGPNAALQMYFLDSAFAELFHVTCSNTGVVSVIRGGTILGATAAGAVPVTGWFFFEVGATLNASTGSVTVRVNGASVLSISGVNNTNSGATALFAVVYGNPGAQGSVPQVAHYYVCDDSGSAPWNTFLGDVRVQTLLPTSNDAVQFTPNGLASNWQNAAKVPPVPGTDFNSDATLGDQDTFNCASLGSGLGTVFGVHVKGLYLKNDAGNRSMQNVLKSGVTTGTGPSTALGTAASLIKTMFQTDPNTNAQWTQAAVNAAKPGYKVSA